MSRMNETDITTTVFPDVSKAISNAVLVDKDEYIFAKSPLPTESHNLADQSADENIPEGILAATALTSHDGNRIKRPTKT